MLHQTPRAIQVIAILRGRVDAERVIQRGNQLVRVNWLALRKCRVTVGSAVHLTARDTATGQGHV